MSFRSSAFVFGLNGASMPALALVLFFVWQRLSAGYFVFPHHQNLFWDRPLGWENLVTVFPSTLFWHGRWVVTVLVLGALLGSWFYPSRSTGLNLASPDRLWSPRIQSISVVVLALLMGNAVFFAKMFWLERYALPVHPGLIVVMLGGISVHLFRSATEWRRGLALGTVVGLGVAMGLLGLYGEADPDEEEHTFAYADVIRTHQRVVELLEANAQHDHRVLTTWPLTVELSDPRLGYVQRPWEAVHVARYDPADETPIGAIVVNPASTHADALRSEAGKRGFSPMDPVRVGHAQSMELYLP